MKNAKKALALGAAVSGMVFGGASVATANSGAVGNASHSPGVISGNTIQVPIDIPVNACGDTIDVIALINPTFGNKCENEEHGREHEHHGVELGAQRQAPAEQAPASAPQSGSPLGGLLGGL